MANIEHKIQSAIIAAARNIKGAEKIFAIPNGGNRNIITATLLKREGVLPGIPDLFLPVARGNYCGLFIEVKTPQGRISTLQKDMLNYLKKQNYCTRIVRTAQKGIKEIRWYLSLHTEQVR